MPPVTSASTAKASGKSRLLRSVLQFCPSLAGARGDWPSPIPTLSRSVLELKPEHLGAICSEDSGCQSVASELVQHVRFIWKIEMAEGISLLPHLLSNYVTEEGACRDCSGGHVSVSSHQLPGFPDSLVWPTRCFVPMARASAP